MAEPQYVSIVMIDDEDGAVIVAAFENPDDADQAADRLNVHFHDCDADVDRDHYGSDRCPYFVAGDGSSVRGQHRLYRSIEEWNMADDGTPGIQLEDA